jgi:tetratricopeptide (TPR) repeat protein
MPARGRLARRSRSLPSFPATAGCAMSRMLRTGMLFGLSWVCLFMSQSAAGGGQSSSSGQALQQAASDAKAGTPAASPAVATSEVVAAPVGPLGEAHALYLRGDFEGATQKYLQLLQEQPKSAEAYAGLTRVYLKSKDVERASDTVNRAVEVADSAPVRVALGEVLFRQGQIAAAEQEWVKVINSGHRDARAFLGLAKVRWSLSLYKGGRTMIDKAYELDPKDPEIQRLWVERLPRAERIKYLEEYLAGPTNDDAETRTSMQHYLEFLKARAKDPRGACRLVSKASSTETPLVRLLQDPIHLRGYGLSVEVNGKKSKLLLDTGASGLLINRSLAEKAGVTKLAESDIGGIGDKGRESGYRALADSLKIGELEFRNCTVEVIDKRSIIGDEGLIGADVFSSFLVDIDFPDEKLHLKELPKRPDETTATVNLQTETDNSEASEDESADKKPAETPAKDKPAAHSGPQDRYIAPEMKSYTLVYRFGHFLLVPTAVGSIPGKLFLLDTGAFDNLITPAAAREVTRVRGDSNTTVKGLSGSVKKVYRADKAVLQFGHLRQENQDLIAFDLGHISDHTGTEISGTLGFTLLRLLDIKIDYRDGLVDFSYDSKRWGQ